MDGVEQVLKEAWSFKTSAPQMTSFLKAEVLAFGEFGGSKKFSFYDSSFLRQALEDSCLDL